MVCPDVESVVVVELSVAVTVEVGVRVRVAVRFPAGIVDVVIGVAGGVVASPERALVSESPI